MSNIIKSADELYKFRRCLEIFKASGLNGDTLMVAIHRMMPRDKNGNFLIEYKIKEQGARPAIFLPNNYRIDFAVNKCNEWLTTNTADIGKEYNVSDRDNLRSYLTMFMLMHEVEHSYEYLMGRGMIAAPCETIREAYKLLNDLFVTPDAIFPNPVKQVRRAVSLVPYLKNQNKYLLERNANLEASSGILSLAKDMDDKEMIRVFTDMCLASIVTGYQDDNKGCLYHTFKDLLMLDYYKKINKHEKMSDNAAARFGLEISTDARDKMLSKIKKKN